MQNCMCAGCHQQAGLGWNQSIASLHMSLHEMRCRPVFTFQILTRSSRDICLTCAGLSFMGVPSRTVRVRSSLNVPAKSSSTAVARPCRTDSCCWSLGQKLMAWTRDICPQTQRQTLPGFATAHTCMPGWHKGTIAAVLCVKVCQTLKSARQESGATCFGRAAIPTTKRRMHHCQAESGDERVVSSLQTPGASAPAARCASVPP